MRFNVLDQEDSVPGATDVAFLTSDRWDDYSFKTQFHLQIKDAKGEAHFIGIVKIGRFDMGSSGGWVDPPLDFEQLSTDYFSLGQDDSYYENLNQLSEATRESVLVALNDIALDINLFHRARNEEVTGKSLLRFVSVSTVLDQFHRMAEGGARLSEYSFTYAYPSVHKSIEPNVLKLSFSVTPESYPPTNVHVIIGRNGVGKTRLLYNMTRILVANADPSVGTIDFDTNIGRPGGGFANVVSVAFSAFDDFEPLSNSQNRSVGILYKYIGLKRIARSPGDKVTSLKDISALTQEFGLSVSALIQQARISRWRRALETLESDPIFADAEVANLADVESDDETLKANARDLFRALSSGHKIVLLTITRLVETLEERSLVLVDEPESHLHPPLLAAFVRALSNLLIERNGVAIVATHSPVILQEVPRSCVWKLRRSGESVAADRPDIETFGENVGILTQEVFGLEVTNSGFHKMLAEQVGFRNDYNEILNRFGGSLGSEARALLQSMLAARDKDSPF